MSDQQADIKEEATLQMFRESCNELCEKYIHEHGESKRRDLLILAAGILDGITIGSKDGNPVDYESDEFVAGFSSGFSIIKLRCASGLAGVLLGGPIIDAIGEYMAAIGFLYQNKEEVEAKRKELRADMEKAWEEGWRPDAR